MTRTELTNIKPSSLQFWDWIEYNSDSMIFNCRVVGLDDEDIFTNKTGGDPIYEEDIYPIILEKKMLADNGFTYEPNSDRPDDGWWCWNNVDVLPSERVWINIAFRNDDVSVYDLTASSKFGDINLHLNFVHELQHALRLLGIEKEITI